MKRAAITAHLYLNGKLVGDVAVLGWHGPWGFGEFDARPAFAPFAPLFDEWARLMHASPRRLSRENAARLRALENRTYALHARLWIVETREWREAAIVNIDGAMIEWKEGWTDQADRAPETGAARLAGLEAA